MATEAKRKANARYDAAHTRQVLLKLNTKTDKDILQRLDEQKNRQGYIKDLIRADISMNAEWEHQDTGSAGMSSVRGEADMFKETMIRNKIKELEKEVSEVIIDGTYMDNLWDYVETRREELQSGQIEIEDLLNALEYKTDDYIDFMRENYPDEIKEGK